MKVLVIGNGGREHVLTWKIAQSNRVDEIYVAPGNAGTAQIATNLAIDSCDIDGLVDFASKKEIDLTFVGPEAPLVAGIVDRFQDRGLMIFGPDSKAAQLEGSKVFSKDFMGKYNIPTAEYRSFTRPAEAVKYIQDKGVPIVVKAEGLAAGKGVFVAGTEEEAIEAVNSIMIEERFGQAGERIVIEEYLSGQEATVLAFVDGETIMPMLPSQDHKPAYDHDQGPNTGGMGAYAPAPVVGESLMSDIYDKILRPTISGLREEGINYKGVLYCGLMIADTGARVLEYNVRFGDPEAQIILPLLQTDIIDIAEAVITGKLADIELSWLDKKAVAVIMASGGYPNNYEKGKVITGIEEADNQDNIIVFQAGTAVCQGNIVTDGGRVLAVTALEEDYQSTIDLAYQGVSLIDFEGAYYRNDIASKALK
ncbi:phosphoribosylamine--glycine ligase [Iocasia frigidifontis]|uniref:Phosphoribosylamine--glycine ligase n=1 Tax=Iocasia fonsfrigidae TaxID=2682810 RepID=A0A8A7KG11_9FIRM|nr:phosphoribosylamine--glycine ligase [Iocasia fonsfrigidae]QTL98449.1 phosphoribosylamine--glycine ligase [Iocasia fonsfrigidae]